MIAARARAWVAVGPVNNRSKPIKNSFIVIRENPDSNINPSKINPAARVSIKLDACILVKKSGMRIRPMVPIKQNKPPKNKHNKCKKYDISNIFTGYLCLHFLHPNYQT